MAEDNTLPIDESGIVGDEAAFSADDNADEALFVDSDGREMYEHFRFEADKGQQLLRVDKDLPQPNPAGRRRRMHHRERQAGEVEL